MFLSMEALPFGSQCEPSHPNKWTGGTRIVRPSGAAGPHVLTPSKPSFRKHSNPTCLSVLRRLPLSVAGGGGGGSLWTSAACLPSRPRAPCPIRDIWGPLLFDFIGLHGADVRRGVLQPRTQTSSPKILPQEFFQKVTAAAVQWQDAP